MWTRFVIVGLIALTPAFARADNRDEAERLAQIIDNVRAHEQLYDDIDVTLQFSYRLAEDDAAWNEAPGTTAMGTVTTTLRQDLEVRYVSQAELFRVDVTGSKATTGGAASPDRIRMYDGTTTRLLDQGQVGNIVKGRSEDDVVFRPHTLLVRSSWGKVYLSEILQGYDSLMASPRFNWEPSLMIAVKYVGATQYQSYHCHEIDVTTRASGQDGWRARTQWLLAEDRNYLPVKVVNWTARQPEIPLGEAVVNEFREIEPGVWFPWSIVRVSYDKEVLTAEGRQDLKWKEAYQVLDVALNPDHDRAFFQTLEFPDGVAMYEVAELNITKSYVIGGTSAAGAEVGGRKNDLMWLLWLNLALGCGVGILYWIRRRRIS